MIGPGPASADPAGISIEPVNPTVDDDVLITVTGQTPCVVPVPPIQQFHSIEENAITITIDVYGNACLTAVDSFTVTENVGKLATGTYDVVASVDVGRDVPDTYNHTFEVTGPPSSPETLPNTGGAPRSAARGPLAMMAGLTLAALGAGVVSRLARSRA